MTRIFWIAAALLVVPSLAVADCPAPLSSDALRERTEGTLGALADAFDELEFVAASQRVTLLLDVVPCVDQPLDSRLSAQVHLARALSLVGDTLEPTEASVRAFRAMLGADPSFRPGPDLVGSGSLNAKALETAEASPPTRTWPLVAGSWIVDGAPGQDRVSPDQNVVLQRLDVEGTIQTWYVSSPEDLQQHIRRTSRPLLAGGIAGVVVGVGGLTMAARSRSAFLALPADQGSLSEAQQLERKNHRSGAVGLIGLATGAGLSVAAVKVGRF